MLGVVKGALDHFGIECRREAAFVHSGHAFVINIHDELCPSGPYVWNYDGFFRLLGNVGLDARPLGTLTADADAADKAALESAVREALDDGAVCGLLNLENQVVLGYDDDGLLMAQPWGAANPTTPARLEYGTWEAYRNGPPLTFLRFDRRAGAGQPLFAALDYAVDLWEHGERHTEDAYGMGRAAYANWLKAIDSGHGGEHGNWWNGVVWAECRDCAGDYFQRIAAAEFAGPIPAEAARNLAVDYRALSRLLYRAADKTAADADKHRWVGEARDLEARCVERIAALRGA
jgi:hypothetical protein